VGEKEGPENTAACTKLERPLRQKAELKEHGLNDTVLRDLKNFFVRMGERVSPIGYYGNLNTWVIVLEASRPCGVGGGPERAASLIMDPRFKDWEKRLYTNTSRHPGEQGRRVSKRCRRPGEGINYDKHGFQSEPTWDGDKRFLAAEKRRGGSGRKSDSPTVQRRKKKKNSRNCEINKEFRSPNERNIVAAEPTWWRKLGSRDANFWGIFLTAGECRVLCLFDPRGKSHDERGGPKSPEQNIIVDLVIVKGTPIERDEEALFNFGGGQKQDAPAPRFLC